MLMKAGRPVVLHAERLFSGRKPTPAISYLDGLTLFSSIQTLLILSALSAIFGRAGLITTTPYTCSTSTEGTRWKSSCLYVVK